MVKRNKWNIFKKYRQIDKTENVKWYHSLRIILLVSYVSISFLPLMFYSSTVYTTLETHYISERKAELTSQGIILANEIASSNFITDDSNERLFNYKINQTSEEINKKISARILILDKDAIVINDSNPTKTEIGKLYLIPEVAEALEIKDVARVQSNNVIYSATAIKDNNIGSKVGVVLISASSKDIYGNLNSIQNQLILLTMLTVVIVGIFVFFISGIITEPIVTILKVIQKMSDGHLDERITVKGHNELYQLSVAFNNMAEKIEEIETTRQEFVSNVSHELKTPLSSVKVLSESLLLQEGIPEEVYREFLQDINSEVDRMTNIINDLLQLVKLDRKQTAIVFKPININKCIEDIIKRLQPLADKKNIKLNYKKEKEVIVDADEMKLSLALSNLVDNAIKYTLVNGTVNIDIDCDHQNAFICVMDTGIGISEEYQSKIFERFYRVDKTRDRETGGTGLGLAITHSTVLLHNGSIKLTSHENEGSTFVVRIPLKQS